MGPIEKNVAGLDGFFWFIGVVESRQDPLALGRVQVRVYNIHSASLTDIPTNDLPWAFVMLSPNGAPPLGIKEDDKVFGFFSDGRSAQSPVVIGILPGFQVQPAQQGQGFCDQRTSGILATAPRKPTSITYQSDGSGVTIVEPESASLYPLKNDLDTPTLSGATRYDVANTVINNRKSNLDKGVVTATGLTWSEPYPAYNALYPYNKAYETESGHLIEYDDTPSAERICFTHRAGSFLEMYPSGSVVKKVTRSNYEIVMGDNYVHIMGRCLVTIGEGAYIRVLGDINIEGDNNLNVNVAGDINFTVGGDFNIKSKNYNATVSDTATTFSGSNQFLTSKGDVHVDTQGTNYLTSQGQLELLASGGIDIMGASISCEVGAEAASFGSENNLGTAPGKINPNSGEAPTESIPVPFPQYFDRLDAETGSAYKQGLFLDSDGSTPDSNTSNTNMSCNFDPNTHTFLPSSSWAMSAAGLTALQQREALAKIRSDGMIQCYPDPATGAQPYTIGYGTTQTVLDVVDPGVFLTLDYVTSKAHCTTWINDTLEQIFIPKLQEYVTVDLTQNMVDALLSFMYNVGAGNFASSTLRKDINSQQWCAAGDSFLLWNKAAGKVLPGLTNRRNAERTQFLT